MEKYEKFEECYKELKELKDVLNTQIKQITRKNDITPVELENAGKAVDILKDMEEMHEIYDKIKIQHQQEEMMETGNKDMGEGYSQRMMPRYYRGGNSYDNGMGMDNGRSGRYYNPNMYGPWDNNHSYNPTWTYSDDGHGRSYNEGYSRDSMIDKLRDMMAYAKNEKEREAIRHCINQLEAM